MLIVDEPAEHLDEATARSLTHDLLTATGDRTVPLINHCTADLPAVDQVIQLRSTS